jgi:hypothetical protein
MFRRGLTALQGDFPPFCEKLMEAMQGMQDTPPRYNEAETRRVLTSACEMARRSANVERISSGARIIVCSGLHSQGRDLCEIFHRFGPPSAERPYLFNGDFADRGPHCVEVALLLASLTVDRPGAIFINRGNHTNPNVSSFERRVARDYHREHLPAFRNWFDALPIAHVVYDSTFVVRGGPPKDRSMTVERLNQLNRFERERAFDHMLWSEPVGHDGQGGTWSYTAHDAVHFLKSAGCKFLLRSQKCTKGYKEHPDSNAATVFSVANHLWWEHTPAAVARVWPRRATPDLLRFYMTRPRTTL